MIWLAIAVGYLFCFLLLIALLGAASWADEEAATRAVHPTAHKPRVVVRDHDDNIEIPHRWVRHG